MWKLWKQTMNTISWPGCACSVLWGNVYSKTCVKRPLSKTPKNGFQNRLPLNAGQKYCKMLQREHSAILSTFIKLPVKTRALTNCWFAGLNSHFWCWDSYFLKEAIFYCMVGLPLFCKEGSGTPVFKILVRALKSSLFFLFLSGRFTHVLLYWIVKGQGRQTTVVFSLSFIFVLFL